MELKEYKIEMVKISDLRPAEYNPRMMTEKDAQDLRTSITKHGLVDPIIVNSNPERKNIIIGGHQRAKIAESMGFERVPVYYTNLSQEDEIDLNLRLNKNNGRWDWDMLANFEMKLLMDVGFTKDEITLNLDLRSKPKTEDDDVPEMQETVVSQVGDLYILGEHRVLCGDATSEEDMEKLMQGQKAQMCFTDPPYNVNYQVSMSTHEKNSRDGIMNNSMSKEDFYTFLFKSCKNIIKNTSGGIYICMSSSELDTLKKAFNDADGHWQSFIMWVKNNFTLSRADYQNTYEPILYGWPAQLRNHYFIQDRDIANVWEDMKDVKTEYKDDYTTISFCGFKVKIKGKVDSGEIIRKKQKTDIWRYDKPTKSAEHPTMKPVELCWEAIKNSSMMREIVIDTFLGSGSTLIACQKNDRACYGMELDPKYIDVIVQRYVNYTGITKIIKNGQEIEWSIKN